MNSILKIIQHIVFVTAGTLLVSLLLSSSFDYASAKGVSKLNISTQDVNNAYNDSYVFNQMFGISVSDIINYAAMETNLNKVPNRNLSVSANSIGINPDKYNNYSDFYKYNNSNIMFYLCSTEGKNKVEVNNIETKYKDLSSYRNHIFNNCNMYLYYDTNGNFETNTKIAKSTVDELFKRNEAYFGDDITFVIGLNKDLLAARDYEDPYYSAFVKYDYFSSDFYLKLVLIILCIFIYIILLIVLTGREGVYFDKDTQTVRHKVYPGDRLPVEVRLLLLFTAWIPYMLLIDNKAVIDYLDNSFNYNFIGFILVIVTFLLVTSILISYFYYGLVRRIKSGLLWKSSILVKIMTKLVNAINVSISNWNDFVKSVIPLLVLAVINIFGGIGLKSKSDGGIVFFIFTIILDIVFMVFGFMAVMERTGIINVIKSISEGNLKNKIDIRKLHGDNIKLGNAVNSIGDSVDLAVEKSMKDERMKADLITNVSHDLKTPLTSIINYVDLLKKENIDNDKAQNYIEILDEKSQRLKQLTDDLVEASKISSGNVVLNMEKINIKELMIQAIGEFSDKFEEKNLNIVDSFEDELYINADSRSMFRIIENLFTNIYKYAMEGTRVYIDAKKYENSIVLSVKNISRNALNISVDELTERFTRGDESRTTEGSGLGLSIAKSLTEAMKGKFTIALDGDLFKVFVEFPRV